MALSTWQPQYLDFARYYGFTPRACQPYRAQTKGKVEHGIKYVRGNFWLGLRFTDLADLNRQAQHWLATVANVRVHGTTGAVPAERLPHEGLLPLVDTPDYDTSLVSYRRSSRDGLISYQGNYYSVPATAVQQLLLVRETEQTELVISTGTGAELACHQLVCGVGQRVILPTHYQAIPRAAGQVTLRAGAHQILPSPHGQYDLDGLHLPDAPVVEVRSLAEYDHLTGVRP